jgi:hypothetical protein
VALLPALPAEMLAQGQTVAEGRAVAAVPPGRTGVLYRGATRAAPRNLQFKARRSERPKDQINVSAEQPARVVGLSRTLLRRKQERRLQKDESERVVRLQRLFEKALEVFEDRDAVQPWFISPQLALGEKTNGFAQKHCPCCAFERDYSRREQLPPQSGACRILPNCRHAQKLLVRSASN